MLNLLRRNKKNEDAGIARTDMGYQFGAHTASDIVRAAKQDRWEGWLAISLISVALMLGTLLWSAFFNIEEVTTGSAKIIPSSREQVLQSLEGGILDALLVHEGDTVEKGQILARIDPTRAQASFRESANRLLALKAQAARLSAEATGKTPDFPDEVKAEPELLQREMDAYKLRKRALDESVAGFVRTKQLILKELAMAKALAAQSLLSKTEVLKLERQANDTESQIVERRNRYRSEANDELSKVEVEMSSLQETAQGRQDTLVRTELRSPVRGIVNNIRINTIGGVIQPGAEIMEVTPLDDQLLVETKIKPSDVAFLAPGQEAVVKLSAYDYSIYGGLSGKVQHISPGALKDEDAKAPKKAAGGEETYYRVMVLTESNTLVKKGSRELRVIPGMTATVDIRTGEKSLLQYLLRPLLRVQEAFREK
ncbi:HlyD family type I secretion periplasmic adaptor subunit [Enterobacteriaceae bacterium H20N1]|uniref:Membrane fusion protein (MFP) family protein n=1 Tax=Dryocola boscaweniae TaxID=2925397 RepID=A0A9X2W9X1_9ENTR|nr:HlyD family type I secretion periplasmic adaptor subunit [Dryocola boscaweniae]MCT4703352.1 HlyD family type I secretion periplasmic adaptor subunit [Dryocola boscaweniae]MCT4720520.1 HlyD family type I secretion periplasmic adaptor subunit [Dryocola boscaweniae]